MQQLDIINECNIIEIIVYFLSNPVLFYFDELI